MLQLKTIHKETFALLKDLVARKVLQGFSLAGGTALALQLGHRISVDLDFFTLIPFDSDVLLKNLSDLYPVSDAIRSDNSLSLFIKQQDKAIKVDLLRHNYPHVRPVHEIESIPLFSREDIAAMKLNAIANRGAKKDFFDIHALLGQFSLQQLIYFFEKKYEPLNSMSVLKSLVYFADADIEPAPLSLLDITWDEIKEDIKNEVKTF